MSIENEIDESFEEHLQRAYSKVLGEIMMRSECSENPMQIIAQCVSSSITVMVWDDHQAVIGRTTIDFQSGNERVEVVNLVVEDKEFIELWLSPENQQTQKP
jgi:hypothetical protein